MSIPHKKHNPAFEALVDDAKKHIKEITVEQCRNLDGLLIDTREDHEWNASHAVGAKHMSRGILERDIETEVPDKSTKLVLYCGGGFRSALAADNLQKMGYTNVESMDGGWKGWVGSGLPTEK